MATIDVDIKAALQGRPEINYVEDFATGRPGTLFGTFIGRIIYVALALGGIAVFMYLIRGGYLWLTAGGDKAKVEEARNSITNSLIGMAIIASALAVGTVVNQFFGTPINPTQTATE